MTSGLSDRAKEFLRAFQHKWEASARVTRLILSDPQFVLELFKWADWTLPEMLPIEPGA